MTRPRDDDRHRHPAQPQPQPHEPAVLRRLLDVALALGGLRRTDDVLQAVLDAACELTGARYAAIGVPDGDGGFGLFVTAGVDAATWAAIGALPRTHGLLGAMLADPVAVRLADVGTHPRFRGWPRAHPDMTAFLGVPIIAGGETVAALYLTDTADGPGFSDADQELVEALAGHAALAVVNAERHERSRELSIAEERTRLARDLHDSVTQTMFSLSLAAESAGALAGPEPSARLTAELDRVRQLATIARQELRDLVDTLSPADADRAGLRSALRRRVALLRRVHDVRIDLDTGGYASGRAGAVESELFKIATEAMSNALQHSGASVVDVTLLADRGRIRLEIVDDGVGFDVPSTVAAGRRLGLVSIRERAEALGGSAQIDSEPGHGTSVRIEVPGG